MSEPYDPFYSFIDKLHSILTRFTHPNSISHLELDPKHFNTQLRRDIVSKVFHYFNVKGKITTKLVKRVGDVAGSGKKPAPQKGRGKARIGNKRAP